MILRLNSRGEQVKVIQEFFGLITDGIFGPITHQAVLKFQKENNLIVDGIVGPQTWAAMAAATTDNTETTDYTDSGLIIHEHHLDEDQYFSPPAISETLTERRPLSEVEVSRSKQWIFLHHTAGWNNPYKVIDSWGRDKRGKIATEFVIGGQNIKDNNNDYDGEIAQAMPEGSYAWHLGVGNNEMHRNSIGIELCNFGYLTKGGYYTRVQGEKKWIEKNKSKHYTYVGTEAHPDQVVKLKTKFRGYEYWHKYSEQQLTSLKDLLIHIGNKHNIDIKNGLQNLINNQGAKALNKVDRQMCIKEKGVWSHSNVSAVKFDVFPQKELLEMILEL
ncbi:MAG: hypothetical protein COA32_05815 [Fluviicola sp.]|nr:MAG: hypothetical protein COA32_05815 [Fluviicola sp.]